MRKRNLSKILIICMIIFSFGLGINANGLITKVTADIDKQLKLTFDGEKVVTKDVNGNEVPILLYNGSSYLPVRSIANLVGLEVGWDGATKTIKLVKDPVNLDNPTLMDLNKAGLVHLNEYDGTKVIKYNALSTISKDSNILKGNNGNIFHSGIVVDDNSTSHEDLFTDFNHCANFAATTIELNRNYKTMKGYLKVKSTGKTATTNAVLESKVKIYDIKNEVVLASYDFKQHGIKENEESEFLLFECDVTDVDSIAILTSDAHNYEETQFIIAGIEFKK